MFKIRYDFKHKSINLKTKQNLYIKLHKKYSQSDLKNRKYSKQRLKSIKILKKINRLIYKIEHIKNIKNLFCDINDTFEISIV